MIFSDKGMLTFQICRKCFKEKFGIDIPNPPHTDFVFMGFAYCDVCKETYGNEKDNMTLTLSYRSDKYLDKPKIGDK